MMAGIQLLPLTGGVLHCLLLGSFDSANLVAIHEGIGWPARSQPFTGLALSACSMPFHGANIVAS